VVAALDESEERYRVLVEGVRQYAIFMLNPEGVILTWNKGVYELLGYGRADVIGRSGAMVFNAADRASGVFKEELAEARRSGESVKEHLTQRKDGREIRVHDTCTALLTADGVPLGFAKVSRLIDAPVDPATDGVALELARALANLQAEVEHRRSLEAQLLTAVEEERQRLGRDLHDDLSQRLAGLAVVAGTFAKQMRERSADDADKVQDIATQLSDAVGAARSLSRGLHPITLTNQGLPAALAELARRVPIEVEFRLPDSPRLDLDPAVALHLYRVAEEAVGNATRHADARKIRITLTPKSGRRIMLTITDDGKGFRQRSGRAGMGIQNMRYRARAVGGTLAISSIPGRGTAVRCTIPLLSAKVGSRAIA
jgi:PAS domain S-box-containing protein